MTHPAQQEGGGFSKDLSHDLECKTWTSSARLLNDKIRNLFSTKADKDPTGKEKVILQMCCFQK